MMEIILTKEKDNLWLSEALTQSNWKPKISQQSQTFKITIHQVRI